jgi:hypothetical protein
MAALRRKTPARGDGVEQTRVACTSANCVGEERAVAATSYLVYSYLSSLISLPFDDRVGRHERDHALLLEEARGSSRRLKKDSQPYLDPSAGFGQVPQWGISYAETIQISSGATTL